VLWQLAASGGSGAGSPEDCFGADARALSAWRSGSTERRLAVTSRFQFQNFSGVGSSFKSQRRVSTSTLLSHADAAMYWA
jgi:hypothetical protein